jgi:hypothetical protein
MTGNGYPKRDQYYAHRLTRLLFKSCACQEIGHQAVCLLCHIAHTEDAARYQGPVTFWNDQLMATLGFKHRKDLNKARNLAIRFGWLHYDRAHDRAVGYYWTDIPARVSGYTDGPIEPISTCTPRDTEVGGLCTSQGTGVGTGVGTGMGTGMGTPSTLSLSLSLNDQEVPDVLEVRRIASHTLERLGNPAGDSRIVHQAAYLLAAGGITEDDVADSVKMTVGKAKQNPLAYFRRCLQRKISEPRFTDLLNQVPAQFTRSSANGQQSRPKQTFPQLQRPSDE